MQILLHTVSGWLILANVAIWIVMVALSLGSGLLTSFPARLLIGAGAMVPQLIPRAPWRLVTTAFLHAEIMHIGFNMLFLGWVGPKLERAYGRGRFVIIYAIALLGGSLLSWGWHSLPSHYGTSVGASGAIMGVIGALFGLAYRAEGWNSQLTRYWAINSALVIGAGALFGLFGGDGTTDNACHVGGWIAGTAAGWLFAGKPPIGKMLERALLGAAAALVVACFALTFFVPASPAAIGATTAPQGEDGLDVLLGRAEDRIDLHRDADARADLERAFATGVSDPDRLHRIAFDAAKISDLELARHAASKAVMLDPGDTQMKGLLDRLAAATPTPASSATQAAPQ